MKIRKISTKDIKEVSLLMLNLYEKWDKIDPIDKIDMKWFSSKKQYDYLNKLIKDRKILFLAAETGGKIAGYLLAEIDERKPFLQNAGYIVEVYTLPEYRGQGIGKALVKETFNWFKERGLKWFMVSTHSLDREAVGFWQKRGFKEFNKHFKMHA